jgi:hypothetical protein
MIFFHAKEKPYSGTKNNKKYGLLFINSTLNDMLIFFQKKFLSGSIMQKKKKKKKRREDL